VSITQKRVSLAFVVALYSILFAKTVFLFTHLQIKILYAPWVMIKYNHKKITFSQHHVLNIKTNYP